MNTSIISRIARDLHLQTAQIQTVLHLFSEGATIPFIARYRKDKTGNLDEVIIENIQDQYHRATELEARRQVITESISGQGKLTPGLEAQIFAAGTLPELEDLYLPYKPKRITRAQKARALGLQPLADLLLAQHPSISIEAEAAKFIQENVADTEIALQGARDIIAEQISEHPATRTRMRKLYETQGLFISSVLPGKEVEGEKYKDYFQFSGPLYKLPSHRILAMLRGFMEGVLRIEISVPEMDALSLLECTWIQGNSPASSLLIRCLKDGYRRLLQPQLETEFRNQLKEKADKEAIAVFAENLKQLLLSAPLGDKSLLAIDPGYRTGCKIVCLDPQGNLLHNDIIYIHESGRLEVAGQKINDLVIRFQVQAIAVGNGTGGRETEMMIKNLQLGLPVIMVNEDGASIYSASELARQEFPDQDVTVRGAVSIGRRLMDPLAELVKIDPKSIGIGQYQHDVNQSLLKEKLDTTVQSCVNAVGVNVNTASARLLSYVSGIGDSLAENIIKHRQQLGGFTSRAQLLDVPRLGKKAFEQCAGFLRIPQSSNPLDASAVHPESYPVAEKIALHLGTTLKELIGNAEALNKVSAKEFVAGETGLLAVQDLLKELQKPGLDPREEMTAFAFAPVYKMEDVKTGDVLPAIITNLTRFGAFADIGIKQDGLIHISEMAYRYISDPSEAVKLGQQVQVKVLEVDIPRKRIALSIKQAFEAPAVNSRREPRKSTHLPAGPEKVTSFGTALSGLKNKFRH